MPVNAQAAAAESSENQCTLRRRGFYAKFAAKSVQRTDKAEAAVMPTAGRIDPARGIHAKNVRADLRGVKPPPTPVERNPHGHTGTVEKRSDLVIKMKEWIDSPQKVKDMAQNCRKLVEQRFDRKKVWEASLDEYQRLVSD